jgi:hypothetical protein
MFADMGINQLVNDDSPAVERWLETQAQLRRIRLQRVS